jgi:transcriptional regulator with XRE-family HTH domain
MTLAKTVKRLRTQRRWTQLELATRVKVSQAFIAQLETGVHQPRLATLQRLAKALKVTVGELVE